MAFDNANPVIPILQHAIGQVFENQRTAQQAAQEKARLEEEKDRRKQQDEQFKVQQKAADLRFKAQQAQQEYENLGTYQKSGITPPGTELIPGLTPTEAQPLVLSGLEKDTLVGPSGSTYQVPPYGESPQQQLLRAAETQKANDKIREQQAQQQAEATRNLQTESARAQAHLVALGVEHDYKKDEQKALLEGQKEIANINNSSRMAVARLKLKDAGDDFANSNVASDTLSRIQMGDLSQEEVNRMPKAMKESVYSIASENEAQILPKAKVDQVKGVENMTRLIPDIRRMILLQATNPIQVNNPMSEVGQEFAALKRKVREAAPQASVALTGVRRFSQPELNRFDEYFIPNKNYFSGNPTANLNVLNGFIGELKTSVDQTTKGLSKKQSSAIRSNLKGAGASFLNTPQAQEKQEEPTKKKKPYREAVVDENDNLVHQ